jgi:hypothetical protein
MTELLEAAGNSDIARVEQLLADEANPLEKDSLGFTALLKSAYFGQKAMFEYLLDKGLGTLSEQTSFGEDAVLTCAYQGHLSMMQWLLTDAGASYPEGRKARLNVSRQLKITDADDAVMTPLLKTWLCLMTHLATSSPGSCRTTPTLSRRASSSASSYHCISRVSVFWLMPTAHCRP